MEYEKIIRNWKEFSVPETKNRRRELNLKHDLISAIIGPRRAGKTYLCFQKIRELIEEGISKENILYLNFEDDRLLNSSSKDLEKLLEVFLENSNYNEKQSIFLFLDEIQNVNNWDIWIRRVHDTKKNIKLILTGSSSKLLSKEISTSLRGRVYTVEVFPLSFAEYLLWKDEKLDIKSILQGGKDSIGAKKYFKEYLFSGGYPATFNNPSIHKEILQNYYDSMILKDVVERYRISDVKKLQILAKLIFESTAREISYNNLANKLKSLGFSTGKGTIIDNISYFEDAYLFFQVLRYEYSFQKQMGSIKKVYCVDNGLLNSVSFSFSENQGKLLENLVFLELRKNGKEIYYNRDKFECDFVLGEKNRINEVIQVCFKLNEENEDREIKGLVEAMKKFKLKKGLIVTSNEERKLKMDGFEINILPFWKWALLS